MPEIDFGAATRIMWACHADTVRFLAPHLCIPGLAVLAGDLRPGSGGRWQGMEPPLEAQRRLLLAQVAECGERLSGPGTWPHRADLLPEVPDCLD